jgi:hypothetical protein
MHPLKKTWIDIDRAIKRLEPLMIYGELVYELKELKDKIEELDVK